jgi:MerR family transcriptional regulator, heat shock protein HspR
MPKEDSLEKQLSGPEAAELGGQSVHTIDVAARLAQVPRRLIVLYFKHGLVAPVADSTTGDWYFDDDAIRVVRRIEQLRSRCGLNLAGIKLVISLTTEVEQLRTELRFHRQ